MTSLAAQLLKDPLALYVVLALLLVQAWSWRRWRLATRVPLRGQSSNLKRATAKAGKTDSTSALLTATVPEVQQAIRAAYPAGEHEEALDLRLAFESEQLLPGEYNSRLDAAAPGMFTAIGIIGTFVGLIISFMRLDFADAANSIQPLIGGMTVAFVNSLVGVGLSIQWTLRSRRARHAFDVASRHLLTVVEERFTRPAHGTQVLGALITIQERVDVMRTELVTAVKGVGVELAAVNTTQRITSDRLAGELTKLSDATQGASKNLLDSLAPRLEESFRSLVDLPFERLGESVEKFRQVVDDTASRNETTLAALDASAGALDAAQVRLKEATDSAKSYVDTLDAGVHALKEGSETAAAIVEESRRAAEGLNGATTTLREVGEQHSQLATSLSTAVRELKGTSDALDGAATRFDAGAERLNEAAGKIQNLGVEAAESSLRAVREELEAAVTKMASALSEFGDRNVAAYEQSSARVINALDSKVTDLTDRLSAELQTLATRLPESAAEITRAAGVLKQRLDAAVRGLEQAVRSLDASTMDTLAARLGEYDKLVAQAVDRFSGTLLTWDGKISDLGAAGREFSTGIVETQREVSAALVGARASAEAAAEAATNASRAAEAVESAATRLSDAQVRALTMPPERPLVVADASLINAKESAETLA